ncbi:MAG: sulfite exporter TauE/SafE family protein, partial [Spirochaetaceae bacterium]|nr:sulfite exporter TauE/SafE family protein [Spirochaetaceae bacterium]
MSGGMSLFVMFFSGFIASIISAIVGFGGAILLLPLLAYFIGIKMAVPLLTIAQIFGNASRAWFGRKELAWKHIINFLISSLPFVIIGSILFSWLNGNIIKVIVGIVLIMIVCIKRIIKSELKINSKGMFIGGALTGIISGIAGSAGPLSALLFNSLNLSVASYIASEAFSALIMHIIKI